MYSDPVYGLHLETPEGQPDYTNYAYWQHLYEATDDLSKQAQMAWEWELRTYFNLTFNQVQEMKTNWKTYYDDNEQKVLNLIPSVAPYQD